MGRYNYYAPVVLGEEWVPIRDEDQTFSPVVNAVEVGHGFELTTTRFLQEGRLYLNEFPPGDANGQVFEMALYVTGTEALTGPIQRVVIPCNNGLISGSTQLGGGASSVADALADPSDNKQLETLAGSFNNDGFQAFFPINSYAQLLNGKRILAVNVLYTMSGQILEATAAGDGIGISLAAGNGSVSQLIAYAANGSLEWTQGITQTALTVSRAAIGEINPFWLPALGTVDKMPWTYGDLQRLEVGATNRLSIKVNYSNTSSRQFQTNVGYMALEVLFCEEQRVAVGAVAFGRNLSTVLPYKPFNIGANVIPMRTVAGRTSPVTLSANDYTVVLSSPSPPTASTLTRYPKLNALRELYEIPSHPGTQVNIPFPMDDSAEDRIFTKEVTHILPQLSLHTSGGPMTEVHVYGRQAVAQVYGTVTATQEIFDSGLGGSATYPQVRFYARRFGDTTVSLLVDAASIPASTASITPTDFDALLPSEGIIDGWKEVTLRFATPPVMGAGTNPQWRFSAAGEVVGNRWEILGANALALSGLPGNLLNLVPSPNQLGTATYGAPTAGTTINLGWVPGVSPPASATTDDPAADAVLLFSQDPPAVSGFAVVTLTQPITGVGLDCGGGAPCCVPTGLKYNRLTWTALTSAVITGFGAYEIQRSDPLTDWQSIMSHASSNGNTFNDYEARVGMASYYRLRAINVYNFAGAWSPTITGTIPSPGVTGGPCLNATGSLIFTSNASQIGLYNLAYVQIFENDPEEAFVFPEAETLQLRRMFRRDYQVAFKPTERGGEAFSRLILVQAAAVSPPKLANMKSLRDMGWADLPYVCVRDEVGDRWYASVIVPSGRVLRNRRLYYATVGIVEVTATPAAIDPAA